MYRITIEEYQEGQGWCLVVKTTDKKSWLNFINLSAFSKLVGLTRGQMRYKLSK